MVDLLLLFMTVKKNGGYSIATDNGLWDLVAKQCRVSDDGGLNLQLLYVENIWIILDTLNRISEEIVEPSVSDTYGESSMDHSNSEQILPKVVSDIENQDVNYVEVDHRNNCDSDDRCCVGKFLQSNEDIKDDYQIKQVSNDVIHPVSDVNELCDASFGGCSIHNDFFCSDLVPVLSEVSDLNKTNVKVDCNVIDPSYDMQNHHTKRVLPKRAVSAQCKPVKKTAAFKKESVSVINERSDSKRKRKRKTKTESTIDWIHRVARDPCDLQSDRYQKALNGRIMQVMFYGSRLC